MPFKSCGYGSSVIPMTFKDLFDASPTDPRKLDAFSGQLDTRKLDGHRTIYRLGYHSMGIQYLPSGAYKGFLDEVSIGRVRAYQVQGPVLTQRTTLQQRPGLTLVWDKEMEHRVPVGTGLRLTIFQIEDTATETPMADMDRWRYEAQAAAGLLATVFDERFVQREVLEDALVFDNEGSLLFTMDRRSRVRSYMPRFLLEEQKGEADQLALLDFSEDTVATMVARWYLRAAETGPVPDSFVFLWTALEALVQDVEAPNVVKQIEKALTDAGLPLPDDEGTIGRIYGTRNLIVHQGAENPRYLRKGFYRLESITRVLLRARLSLARSWPATVGANDLPEPFKSGVDEAWMNPTTFMR